MGPEGGGELLRRKQGGNGVGEGFQIVRISVDTTLTVRGWDEGVTLLLNYTHT